ncbi:MAG: energy transducer TonB [Acidobacteriaceae bacterium]
MSLFLSIGLLSVAPLAHAQANGVSATKLAAAAQPAVANPKTPAEFFARARQLSDLEAAGIPFHLKATYVATGDTEFTGNGTYEEWWQSNDVWRKEATLGKYKWVEIKNGEKPSLYTTSRYIPWRLRQAVSAVLIRIDSNEGVSADWKIKHRKIGGNDFATLSASYKAPNSDRPIAAQDLFTPEGVLRIQQTAEMATLYNNFESFQNLPVPRKIDVASGPDPCLAISVETLEPFTPSEEATSNLSSIPKDLTLLSSPFKAAASSNATAARLIHQVQPNYPVDAKQQRIQGTVVLGAEIDENGYIQDLHIVHSAGPRLDNAAKHAVREWRYKPTAINGQPIAVETTISVVFALNH